MLARFGEQQTSQSAHLFVGTTDFGARDGCATAISMHKRDGLTAVSAAQEQS
jgi:hypothetical protein